MQIEVVFLGLETTLFVNSRLVYEHFLTLYLTQDLPNELNFKKISVSK
jgi:hypothetical protein